MTNRIKLLTAVAAIAFPAAMAGAQMTTPPTSTTPPATGSVNTGTQTTLPVPNATTPPAEDTADQVTQPITEPPQQPTDAATTTSQQAQQTAEDTADAVEADAQVDAAAQTQAQTQMPPTPAPAQTQTQPAATAQAQTGTTAPAGQTTLATAADVRSGVQVRDQTGGLVGTIESVDAAGAVVSTGTARAKIPVNSFGRNNQGLVISMTKAQLEAAVAANRPAPTS